MRGSVFLFASSPDMMRWKNMDEKPRFIRTPPRTRVSSIIATTIIIRYYSSTLQSNYNVEIPTLGGEISKEFFPSSVLI